MPIDREGRPVSFRTILVNLNETTNNAAVMAVAVEIARRFDAYLKGLYVIPAVRIYPSARYEPIPVMFEAHRDYFDQQAKSVETAFDAALVGVPVGKGFHIERSPSPLICDSVLKLGRACDLIMVSQTEVTSKRGVELDFVPRVAVAAGRPVMVIPLEPSLRSQSETVVIGWNASREAARVVFDSLPLLRSARTVHVVWVDPPSEARRRSSPPGEDIALSLRSHGVMAVASPIVTDGENAGETLLKKARDLGAGLLVIGAYGRSRLSEFVLGGVTRTVLRQMRCPVLLSH